MGDWIDDPDKELGCLAAVFFAAGAITAKILSLLFEHFKIGWH